MALLSLDTLTAGLKRGFADCLEELISWHMTYAEVNFSVGRLAKETRYKPSWLREAFIDLEARGLLKRQPRSGDTNIYRLMGAAAEYLKQLRDLRAKKAKERSDANRAYVNRVARIASKTYTPPLSGPNSSLHYKEREELALTVVEQKAIQLLRVGLGAESPETPLSQLWAKKNPRL